MTHCDSQPSRRAASAGANLGWTALNLLALTARLAWTAGRIGAVSRALRGDAADDGRHG